MGDPGGRGRGRGLAGAALGPSLGRRVACRRRRLQRVKSLCGPSFTDLILEATQRESVRALARARERERERERERDRERAMEREIL